ncbi:MAG: hypothetical protein ACK2UB_14480 [Anaerolineales bacterium]
MKTITQTVLRWIALLAVAATTGACNLTLSADSSGSPQVLIVTATPDSQPADTQQQPPPDSEPAATHTPTLEFTPTHTPTATEALPTMTAGQELSCVKGPHWILFEWVAKVSEGETVTLLAKASEDWEEYYYVRKSNGTECWAFGGSSTKTGEYYNLPVREAPPLPEIEFTIENQTGLEIFDVFIREEDSTDWGADRLGATGTIPIGGTFSLTLTAGFYDVKISDPTHHPLYEMHDRPIGADANYRYLVLNQKMEFYIQNNYAFTLCEFQLRPIGSCTWDTVHSAADGAVATGERITVDLLPGFYDIRIDRCSGPNVVNGLGWYFGPALDGYIFP